MREPNTIQIAISGPCGSGKTEVMALIQKVLQGFYGSNAIIQCEEPIEDDVFETCKYTGQTCVGKDTIFKLVEKMESDA